MTINLSSISQPNTSVTHLDWLDQVRGIAALYVVIHHAVINVAISGSLADVHDPIFRFLQTISAKGHYAVDVFIVLSGYCLMLPLIRKETFGSIPLFYLRRTVRIVLPYYAAMLLSLSLIYFLIGSDSGTHWASCLPVTVDGIVKHIFLVHQWFPSEASKINHVFWSIGVEYQIYFLFPFFYLLTRKYSLISSWVAIALLGYAFWLISIVISKPAPPPAGESFVYCGLFFLGMMAAKYSFSEENILPSYLVAIYTKPKLYSVIIVAMVVVIALIGNKYREAMPLLFQSLFIGIATSLIFFLKSKEKIKFFENKYILNALNWLGKIGFSLYLIHAPMLELVWLYIVNPLKLSTLGYQSIGMVIFGTVISIAVAWIFYILIEQPCHRLSKSIKTFSHSNVKFFSYLNEKMK